MQQRRHDLERKLPLRPQTSEQVEYDKRLADSAEERRYGREEEEAGKKEVGSGVYAVEDDGYMGEEFANNVESTCHIIRSAQPNHTLPTGRQSVPLRDPSTIHPIKDALTPHRTKNKLNRGILLPRQIQTNRNRSLRHHDRPEMMHRTNRTDPGPIHQLKDVHPAKRLRTDHQYISQSHTTAGSIPIL